MNYPRTSPSRIPESSKRRIVQSLFQTPAEGVWSSRLHLCNSNCSCRLASASLVRVSALIGTWNCWLQNVHTPVTGVELSHFTTRKVGFAILIDPLHYHCFSGPEINTRKSGSGLLCAQLVRIGGSPVALHLDRQEGLEGLRGCSWATSESHRFRETILDEPSD